MKEFGADIAEFIAIGTAVKAEPGAGGGGVTNWRNNKGMPFTSDLSGQDFWTLIRAGYAPLGMTMGTCVYHIAHQRLGAKMGNIGRNVEIEQFTQALYDARELAMARMQAEAEELKAEGIVGVQLRQHSHTWGSHTTEFFAIGTAVRPLREDHVIQTPTMVLSLDSVRPGFLSRARRAAACRGRLVISTSTRLSADEVVDEPVGVDGPDHHADAGPAAGPDHPEPGQLVVDRHRVGAGRSGSAPAGTARWPGPWPSRSWASRADPCLATGRS